MTMRLRSQRRRVRPRSGVGSRLYPSLVNERRVDTIGAESTPRSPHMGSLRQDMGPGQ
jgi:hypothetical protein